jgi:hypothetical protein
MGAPLRAAARSVANGSANKAHDLSGASRSRQTLLTGGTRPEGRCGAGPKSPSSVVAVGVVRLTAPTQCLAMRASGTTVISVTRSDRYSSRSTRAMLRIVILIRRWAATSRRKPVRQACHDLGCLPLVEDELAADLLAADLGIEAAATPVVDAAHELAIHVHWREAFRDATKPGSGLWHHRPPRGRSIVRQYGRSCPHRPSSAHVA